MEASTRLEISELGIDIIRVGRISEALARFGERFVARVLTPKEAAYVRGRPRTLAGRWAANPAPESPATEAGDARLATAIAYLARNGQVTVLAYAGAALVGQSRVESEAHSIPQVLLGALLGFVITVFVFQVLLTAGVTT